MLSTRCSVYDFELKYLIKPLSSFEISEIDSERESNSFFVIYSKSKAKYNCDLTSPAEALAIYRK